MPETGGSTVSASPGEYPDPRLEPFLGFALAAEAGVRHLHALLGMDLWLVTHLEHDELVVVASAGPWDALMPPGTRVPWTAAFCSRMVERAGPVCAPDVLDVPAYAPLVSGVFGRVRAYVGIPLEGDDGRFFGTLSAVSGARQPSTLPASVPAVQVVGRMLSTIVAREQVAQARSADAAAAYSRGSTGSDSRASTAKTHSCTRHSGSPRAARSRASTPRAYSRCARPRLRPRPRSRSRSRCSGRV